MSELDGLWADGSVNAPEGGWSALPIRNAAPPSRNSPWQTPAPAPTSDHAAAQEVDPPPPPRKADYDHIARLEREVLDTLPAQWVADAEAALEAAS